jgi:hypothetical protein
MKNAYDQTVKQQMFIAAARAGDVDAVKTTLADRAIQRNTIKDALDAAAESGHAAVVAVLAADLYAYARTHRIAVKYAVEEEQTMAMKSAVAADRTDVLGALVTAGANVHANREIALRMAVRKGNADAIRVLIAGGADPVMAWVYAEDEDQREKAVTAFDACSDVMTPEQRGALVALSGISASVQPSSVGRAHAAR